MSTLPDISEHLHVKQGFCHPDWRAISDCIERGLPEKEWNSAWQAVSRAWVDRIRDTLAGAYQVYETANFLILSGAPKRVIRDACSSYEDALKRILRNLEGAASHEGFGKHVVLMFADLDDYYGYISYFYSDGEHPMTGGVCLGGEGYMHFAFPTTDYSTYRTVLVHELTHGCLTHLPIPAWLNEALAMRMEQLICGSDTFALDQETYDKHSAHWNAETIQQFWSGESWEIPGDSFELSYNLAQVLWRKIEVDLAAPRDAILQFICGAVAADAGDAACQTVFDISLGDLVMNFLGDGPWPPEPAKWPGNRQVEMEKTSLHSSDVLLVSLLLLNSRIGKTPLVAIENGVAYCVFLRDHGAMRRAKRLVLTALG